MASTSHHGAKEPRGFGDTIWARLIALAIAVGLSWLFWTNWGDDVTALVRRRTRRNCPSPRNLIPNEGMENPALQACLEKRLGDVQQMVSDGVISEAQSEGFQPARDRALLGPPSQLSADVARARHRAPAASIVHKESRRRSRALYRPARNIVLGYVRVRARAPMAKGSSVTRRLGGHAAILAHLQQVATVRGSRTWCVCQPIAF